MRLELVWTDRKATAAAQVRLRFLDFQVDGQSLSEAHKQDLVSCLGWFVPEQDEFAAQRLLGEAPPDVEDRVALCVCPECGDVLCGAVTARITHSGDDVFWSDFACSWYDADAGRWQHDPADLPEYHFDADAYRRTIIERPRGGQPG